MKLRIDIFGIGLVLFLSAMPASNSYKLNGYGFGSGGGSSSSDNYSLNAATGETSGPNATSTPNGTQLKSGEIQTIQAHTPGAPTFVNQNNNYDKLHFTLDTANNPTDAKFAIAISADDFVTTQYIQSDNTVGNTLGVEDFQTYSQWGSGSGADVIGLLTNTTYKIKAKATGGKFTEGAFGPTATAATVSRNLTFDIDVASTDTESSAPFSVSLEDLLPATVTTAANKIWIDIDTNGASGGKVFIRGTEGGLRSTAASNLITSGTADLSSTGEGFGVQVASATQSSGATLTAVSPYNGSSNSVGITDTLTREILNATAALAGGRASFSIKAKASAATAAAADYAEILTVIASASF